jgi:hypothetical protein
MLGLAHDLIHHLRRAAASLSPSPPLYLSIFIHPSISISMPISISIARSLARSLFSLAPFRSASSSSSLSSCPPLLYSHQSTLPLTRCVDVCVRACVRACVRVCVRVFQSIHPSLLAFKPQLSLTKLFSSLLFPPLSLPLICLRICLPSQRFPASPRPIQSARSRVLEHLKLTKPNPRDFPVALSVITCAASGHQHIKDGL